MELGASVYFDDNALVRDLSIKFGLKNYSLGDDKSLGIWNGKSFDIESSPNNYITMGRFLWKYGLAPYYVNNIATKTSLNWKQLYFDEEPWESIEEFLVKFRLFHLTRFNAYDYLVKDNGINVDYVNQVISGMTRVTYNSNITDISALGGLISIIGSGARLYTLEEGNYLVCEKIVQNSKATLILNSKVLKINKADSQYEVVSSSANGLLNKNKFDIVVIAAPIELNNIEFGFDLAKNSKGVREYRKVHVTLVRGTYNPSYFSKQSINDIPDVILTNEKSTSPFNSIGLRKTLSDGTKIVKFFSTKSLSDQDLDTIFSKRVATERHELYAYPILKDNNLFPPVKLNNNLYYVNAFESAVSVMEGEVVSGQNIARLITKKIYPDKFKNKHPTEKEEKNVKQDL